MNAIKKKRNIIEQNSLSVEQQADWLLLYTHCSPTLLAKIFWPICQGETGVSTDGCDSSWLSSVLVFVWVFFPTEQF